MKDRLGELQPEMLERMMVGEPFRSRKNHVFRIRWEGALKVAKVYAPERIHLAELEFGILSRCAEEEVPAPHPIALGPGAIIMDYVEAENLSDEFDRLLTESQASKGKEIHDLVTDGVAAWLAKFHKRMGGCTTRGDSVLRNFLISGGTICGLDFEESSARDPLDDVAEVAANMLGMSPAFTPERFALVDVLAERYWHHSGTDRSAELPSTIADALDRYAQFRSDGKAMRVWAQKLRVDGLPR